MCLDALIFLVYFVCRSGKRGNDKTLLCLMSMVHHWGWRGRFAEAVQELLSHHAGKKGDKMWNQCLSWQAGMVTMAQTAWALRKLQQTAGRRVEETDREWGNAKPCSCPCYSPWPATRQPKSQHAIRDTDGLLLGGCEFNADLRAIAMLFTAAQIQIYTTAWQINTLTFLCQIERQKNA